MIKRVLMMTIVLALLFVTNASSDRVPKEHAEFTFARLAFNFFRGPGAYNGEGQEPWEHDYPHSEDFYLGMLGQVTGVATDVRAFTVVPLDSDDIFKYPFLYVSEPGFMQLTSKEEKNFRDFFNRGGFAMFDDFRGRHLANLEDQLLRVFPDRQLKRLEISEPIFRSFYEMKTLDVASPYGDDMGIPPSFWGMKDEDGRLILIANVANDFGEYWEDIDRGREALQPAVNSFQFGINYLLYAMTH
jgi:hypothetical protein